MKHCRRVVILIFIMAAVFALMSPASFAMGPSSFKAWIAAALTAANIVADSTLPAVAPVEDFLINPFNITDTVMDYVDYQYPFLPDSVSTSPRESLAQYMEREGTITVRGDTITIDGIDYTDIWVDNDAAQALRTNVFDLETAWQIASNSSGNFVSGVGSWCGVPFYALGDGTYRSQNYLVSPGTSSVGDFTLKAGSNLSGNYTWCDCYDRDGYQNWISGALSPANSFPVSVYWWSRSASGNRFTAHISNAAGVSVDQNQYDSVSFSPAPFDFTWVSKDIPAERLSEDEGLHILVPNNPEQFTDPVVQQNITNFNNNLTFSPDVSINMSDPGVMDALDLLMDTINTLINLTKPSYGPYDQSPVPPVPPVDPDSIANTPWVQLQQRIDHIINQFTSQGNIIGTISSQLGDIINSIGDITGQIVNGDRKWYKDITESLQKPFLPILTTFKNVTGIWHYVVSWVGVISAPFSWSLSTLGSAGSIFLAPLYAAFAAAIVIAIYRRFGK